MKISDYKYRPIHACGGEKMRKSIQSDSISPVKEKKQSHDVKERKKNGC